MIQGYTGFAKVDDKCQVVVDAQVFGEGHEANNLEKVVLTAQCRLFSIRSKRYVDLSCRQTDEIIVSELAGQEKGIHWKKL